MSTETPQEDSSRSGATDFSAAAIREIREHHAKLLYASELPEIKGTKVAETFRLLADNARRIIDLVEP